MNTNKDASETNTSIPRPSDPKLALVQHPEHLKVKVVGTKHPLAMKAARCLNSKGPEFLHAMHHTLRDPDTQFYHFALELVPGDITFPVTIVSHDQGKSVRVQRFLNIVDDPCPFLPEDSGAWWQLLCMLKSHLGEDDPFFRQVRLFRWTGTHLTLDGTAPNFSPPDLDRQRHPDIVDPREVGEDNPVPNFALSWLEWKLSEIPLQRSPTGDGE